MEKHYSRSSSSAKRILPASDESFDLSSLVLGEDTSTQSSKSRAKPARSTDKLTREDLSRCITIWASMYLDQEKKSAPADLLLPSRPWLGRSPNGKKQFE